MDGAFSREGAIVADFGLVRRFRCKPIVKMLRALLISGIP